MRSTHELILPSPETVKNNQNIFAIYRKIPISFRNSFANSRNSIISDKKIHVSFRESFTSGQNSFINYKKNFASNRNCFISDRSITICSRDPSAILTKSSTSE
jgi:hypothetical protein